MIALADIFDHILTPITIIQPKIPTMLERKCLCLSILEQASSSVPYHVAYLLTIVVPIMQVPTTMVHLLETIQFILYPLQGFYNIIVFIQPDAKRLRRRNTDMPLLLVITTAITSYTGPMALSRLSNQRTTTTSLSSNEAGNVGCDTQRTGQRRLRRTISF